MISSIVDDRFYWLKGELDKSHIDSFLIRKVPYIVEVTSFLIRIVVNTVINTPVLIDLSPPFL